MEPVFQCLPMRKNHRYRLVVVGNAVVVVFGLCDESYKNSGRNGRSRGMYRIQFQWQSSLQTRYASPKLLGIISFFALFTIRSPSAHTFDLIVSPGEAECQRQYDSGTCLRMRDSYSWMPQKPKFHLEFFVCFFGALEIVTTIFPVGGTYGWCHTI